MKVRTDSFKKKRDEKNFRSAPDPDMEGAGDQSS